MDLVDDYDTTLLILVALDVVVHCRHIVKADIVVGAIWFLQHAS